MKSRFDVSYLIFPMHNIELLKCNSTYVAKVDGIVVVSRASFLLLMIGGDVGDLKQGHKNTTSIVLWGESRSVFFLGPDIDASSTVS